jgi:glycosyltransferase involved in cell wall biosynthesis
VFIFNCTTNITGGAVQNSVNFIREALSSSGSGNWFFLVNDKIFSQLSEKTNEQIKVFPSPAKSYSARKSISKYIASKPNSIVYTSAGPAYISIKNYHVIGCSNPYVLGIDKEINVKFFSGFDLLKRELLTIYQRRAIIGADAYIFQTEHSRQAFFKHTSVKADVQSTVISNAISSDFSCYLKSSQQQHVTHQGDVINVLVPSAYYKHKCLEIIPSLIVSLNQEYKDKKYIFSLTVKDDEFLEIKKSSDLEIPSEQLVNLGTYNHSDAVGLYKKADIIFQPSLIEVFSTTYIEAIAMGLPLVVPDTAFSRGICKNYPSYYDFNNLNDCVRSFSPEIVFNNKNNERDFLSEYGNQSERFKKIESYLYKLKEKLNV